MLPHQGDAITVEKKLKYLREIENIHRLSKRVLPPQGTTWARIADSHLRKALDLPVVQKEDQLNMKVNGMHHEHSPRTARLIERTLRNGVHHPDLLHSYRGDNVQVTSGKSGARKAFFRAPQPTARDALHPARVQRPRLPPGAPAGLRLRADGARGRVARAPRAGDQRARDRVQGGVYVIMVF